MNQKRKHIFMLSLSIYNFSYANNYCNFREFNDNIRNVIGIDYFDVLNNFIMSEFDKQKEKVMNNGKQIIEALIETIIKVGTNNKSLLNFWIPTLDGILMENPELVDYIYELQEKKGFENSITKFLLNILYINYELISSIIYDSSLRIVSLLLVDFNHYHENTEDIKNLVNFLINIGSKDNKNISKLMICISLSYLLNVKEAQDVFYDSKGYLLLKNIAETNSTNLQIIYYLFLDLWIISSNPVFKNIFADPRNLFIIIIKNAIKNISREKISRIAFKILRNLSDWEETIPLIVENNIQQIIYSEQKKNIKDEELNNNLNHIDEIIDKNQKILSSFDKYIKELQTEKLRWGARHNERFWKENVKKFEDNDFYYIKKLISLLKSSDKETKAVVCYDLGEFSRFYPFSKIVLEKYNGKESLMEEIKNEDTQIRENALLAVQKLMIHNWQKMQNN